MVDRYAHSSVHTDPLSRLALARTRPQAGHREWVPRSPARGPVTSVEVVLAALADVVDGGADVALAVHRLLLGDVAEHLDPEPAVQVADDPLLPRPPDDLRRQAARRPRLGHDVVGDRVGAGDQPGTWHDFVDHPPFEGLLGGDRFPGQQRVRGALDPEELLEGV